MEFRVKFSREEDDSYVELWQLVGEQKYVARHTCGPAKSWCHVSDPLGYRELDHPFKDDDVFIVCDQEGNELFRSRNGDGSANFNTPKQEAFAQWGAYAKQHKTDCTEEDSSVNFYLHWATGTPAGSFHQWLLSFQDPDLYPEAKDYPENWIHMHNERVGEPEVLAESTYLGEKKQIERIHFRHKICGVEWDEYYSGDYYVGAGFDKGHIGTMYSESQARNILTKAIMSHFSEHTLALSYVEMCGREDDGKYPVQRNVKKPFAYQSILQGNLHRDFVDRLTAEEREKSHFYEDGFRGIEEIRKEYPDCIEDHSIVW